MLAHLSLTTPRGPLAADLDPRGVTTISGPTGAGKSVLVAAGIALITGAHFYGSTAEGASGGGAALRIDQAGKDRSFSAESKARSYRGKVASDYRGWSPLGADPELVDVIAGHRDGRRWQDLAAGTGQELRDLLVRVLPPLDLRGRILDAVTAAGHTADAGLLVVRVRAGKSEVTLDPADPTWPEQAVKALESAQTAANAASASATGRAEQADATVQRMRRELPTPPDTAALEAAARVDATARAWATYDAAQARYEADVARVAEQRRARDEHAARVRALGRKPERPSDALAVASKRLEEARASLRVAEKAAQDQAQRLAVAEALAQRGAGAPARGGAALAEAQANTEITTEAPPIDGANTPASTYSDDYRRGFADAVTAAAAIVQWCRENGETDHRSMLWPIRGLTPENQHNRSDEEAA